MKDSYLSDDAPDLLGRGASADTGTVMPSTGMGHSIRPRRIVLEQAQKRMLEKTYESEPEPEPFAPEYEAPAIVEKRAFDWHDLPIEDVGPKAGLKKSLSLPVADADRDNATVRAFDLLRTRLRQTIQDHGWTNIAVTAPTSACGNTFTAVNLALSLSRITGSRTVLMDMNMRKPGIAAAFDMDARGAISDYLEGNVSMTNHMIRVSDTLALGLNREVNPNPAETLQDPATAVTLQHMRDTLRPEIVIYDMPPMLSHDDVSGFLPQLDGVLIVSDGTQTTARQLSECERMLDGQVPLLGVVLNRARRSSIARYS
ncbi:MAG: CpsD/CapB family tyrosine-protein kinase [Sulfitobacter sp.]